MDYHSDRFQDFSLMIYKKEKLVALLPANVVGTEVYSHQGLTFGGLIFNQNLTCDDIQKLLNSICEFYKKSSIHHLYIKQLPQFYSKSQTNKLGYVLGLKGELYRRDMVLAIDYLSPLQIHKTKLKRYKKLQSIGFEIRESNNFSNFWNSVLIPRLSEKHNAQPVHNLEEIQLLNSKFPENIKQFDVYLEGDILAGITIFENKTVVKSQYGATTLQGEQLRALDFLFLELIYKYKQEGKQFFSMGTVTDFNKPESYNKGLLKQKEELGCNIHLQDFFKLTLS